MVTKFQNQFTPARLITLTAISAAVVGFILWMQFSIGVKGAPAAPTRDEWATYRFEAILSVIGVIIADAIIIWLTIRHHRQKEREQPVRTIDVADPKLNPARAGTLPADVATSTTPTTARPAS